jgi:nitroreductase
MMTDAKLLKIVIFEIQLIPFVMDIIKCIKTRRSIRKYIENKPIQPEQVQVMIEAGMYAPTARNLRGWHFVVINEKEKLVSLSEIHPYGKMLTQAALGILVCGDKAIEPNEAYNAINCAAATQNILLSAHHLGLGAVWLGVYPREERMTGISKELNLPEHVFPVALISIGYPDEIKETPERIEKEKIHYNSW